VADPGNLGTILRTCDATGIKGVILLDSCTDPYDPTALRGSMGAIFSVQLIKATLIQFESWVHARRIPVIGASDKAKQNYYSMSYPNPMVLLMGSERQGLDQRHLDLCAEVVSIPMRGRSDSLNLAVATGILLYEMDHQFRTGQESEGKTA
jgi:TrmH family RNA methyltransferase